MSITDELRHNIEGAEQLYGREFKRLAEIADRIDTEHEEAIQHEHEKAYDAGYQNGENAVLAVFDKRGNADVDERMAEHGWYRALDADKQPIHADDELFWKECGDSAGRVTAIGIGQRAGWVWTMEDGCKVSIGHEVSKLRHYHAPIVEDVLLDMHRRLSDVSELYDVDSDELEEEYTRIIEEFAAKLRLAVDQYDGTQHD